MKKKTRKNILTSLLLFFFVLTIIIVLINLYLDILLNRIEKGPVINIDDAGISEEIVEQNNKVNIINIVLFGADNDGDKSDMQRSDAIKVLSLDYTNKEIKISSLERDLVVWLPDEYNRYAHLNWAYWYGEANLAIKTINYNFDLDITKYVTVSFESVEKIVDLVDGIELKLTKNELDVLHIKGLSGIYNLDGKQALAYSRIRKLDSDYQRMERQQKVINALVLEISEMTFSDLLDFIKEALPYITTNLTTAEIKNYASSLLSFDLNIKTHQVPKGGYDDTCICPGLGGYLVSSYSNMVKDLHDFIYGEGFYSITQNIMNIEKAIYDKYGACDK